MDISIKWFDSQFNVILATKTGAEPFLEVKGLRIVNGQNGPFVSWPSTKNQNTGKYWNHAYASEKFNAVVLEKAQASQPAQQPRGQRQSRQDDQDESIPF